MKSRIACADDVTGAALGAPPLPLPPEQAPRTVARIATEYRTEAASFTGLPKR